MPQQTSSQPGRRCTEPMGGQPEEIDSHLRSREAEDCDSKRSREMVDLPLIYG